MDTGVVRQLEQLVGVVNSDRHEYALYLAVEDIDHTKTKVKSPQTNGICERFHRTILDEFYKIRFRKKRYRSLEELRTDFDAFIDSLTLAKQKLLSGALQQSA